jgi:hypothetical protein
MREAKLKLNPDKGVFGVTRGKVLGCLVSTKGIEARPKKNQGHPPDATSANQKRGAKVDRPHTSLEQVHYVAGRKKPPLLQHIKGLHKSRMGARATKGLQQSEVVPPAPANTIKSRTGPASHIVHLHHTLSGQQSSGHSKGSNTKGNLNKAVVPSLLCLQGISRIQKVLL